MTIWLLALDARKYGPVPTEEDPWTGLEIEVERSSSKNVDLFFRRMTRVRGVGVSMAMMSRRPGESSRSGLARERSSDSRTVMESTGVPS